MNTGLGSLPGALPVRGEAVADQDRSTGELLRTLGFVV